MQEGGRDLNATEERGEISEARDASRVPVGLPKNIGKVQNDPVLCCLAHPTLKVDQALRTESALVRFPCSRQVSGANPAKKNWTPSLLQTEFNLEQFALAEFRQR